VVTNVSHWHAVLGLLLARRHRRAGSQGTMPVSAIQQTFVPGKSFTFAVKQWLIRGLLITGHFIDESFQVFTFTGSLIAKAEQIDTKK